MCALRDRQRHRNRETKRYEERVRDRLRSLVKGSELPGQRKEEGKPRWSSGTVHVQVP